MPLPISGGRSAGDALELLKDRALKEWRSAIPRDAADKPMGHKGGARALLNFAQGGQLGGQDETGAVLVGPNGITVRRAGQPKADAMGIPQDEWSLTVNPSARSAEFQRGDLGIGGKWDSQDPSIFVRKGGLELTGGNGFAPGGSGPDKVGYGPVPQSRLPERGIWGSIGFTTGEKPIAASEEEQQLMAADAVSGAVSPFQLTDREVTPKSARQELEEQLGEYRVKNPYWYRP